MSNNISFKAQFISPATIKQLYQIKGMQDKAVSFVELEARNINDRKAMQAVDRLWGEGDTFVAGMVGDVDYETLWGGRIHRYFALTSQLRDFDKVVADKVLGMAEIVRNSDNLINLKYLQAHPDNLYYSFAKLYSGIGTAILNSIKLHFPTDDIILNTVESAREFYKMNGFKEFDKGNILMFKHSATEDLPK